MTNSEYHRQYYQRNKERILLRQKQWQQANPDKVKAIKKNHRDRSPDKVRESRQKYQATLSGCLARKLGHLKKAKRARTLDVDIDLEFLLSLWKTQGGCCAISSYPMSYSESSIFGVSIDRIDSSKGYTKDNVQLLCQGINFAKNKFSNQDMIEFWNYRFRRQPNEEVTPPPGSSRPNSVV